MGKLVLSRKNKQGVWVGDAHIEVITLSRGRTKIVVTAPAGVRVVRDELVSTVAPKGDSSNAGN